MSRLRAAVFAALFIFGMAPMAVAQDVTLTSRDGAVEISGTILGHDGEFFRLDTVYGELTVDASGVLCEGPGCPNLDDYVAELRISGADSMGRILIPALIETYALRSGLEWVRRDADNQNFTYVLKDKASAKTVARFAIRLGTTDEGFADLLANEADIAMALREIRPQEARLAHEAGMGELRGRGRSRVLALDALVAVVAPGNPISAITLPELAGVYAGRIDNWQLLGGPDAPISVHLRDSKSGLGQAVEDRLLVPLGLTLASGVTRHSDSDDLVAAVMADPFGIGVTSFSEVGNTAPMVLTGHCGFSLEASRRTVKTEDYPLTSPMFLYLPARRLPKLVREFLTYTRSHSAQLVIRRAGFVDQVPEEISLNDQGNRLANAIARAGPEIGLEELHRMVGRMARVKRLSTTFRFEAGSARLDAQSRSNVQQLAHALEAGQYDTRRLLFVGFSDGEGAAKANQEIALRRADAVRIAVVAAAKTANLDRLILEVDAFGEAMPMACDDSDWGRQVNRRVEVWVQ